MERGQAEALVPMIGDVLTRAGLAVENLDIIAVTTGPGAFTGVRIGLAAARGLALARAIPCVGVTTFEAVAFPAVVELRPGETLVSVIESKRAELFLQAFDATLHPVGEAFVQTPEAAAARLPPGPLLLAGDGALRLLDSLASRARLSSSRAPNAAAFAPFAARRFADGQRAGMLRPFYMRPPDAKPMLEPAADG